MIKKSLIFLIKIKNKINIINIYIKKKKCIVYILKKKVTIYKNYSYNFFKISNFFKIKYNFFLHIHIFYDIKNFIYLTIVSLLYGIKIIKKISIKSYKVL